MTVREIADQAWMAVAARVAIFVATFIALPIAGWMLLRAATTVDKILEDTQRIQLRIVDIDGTSKLVAEQLRQLRQEYEDHEGRIRLLERSK